MINLSAKDILEIEMVLARFAFIHDDRYFDLYHLIFTSDAMLDTLYTSGTEGMQSVEGLKEMVSVRYLPKGIRSDHFTMNTIIVADAEGGARARSRYITHWDDGRIGSGDYLDIFRRTPDGWRISLRKAVRRMPPEFGTPPAEFFHGWPCALD